MLRPILRIYVNDHTFDASVDKDLFTIGRSETCDIVLNDASISFDHAKVEKRDNQFFLVDCGSLNGILYEDGLVNEVLVKEGESYYLGHVRIEVLKFSVLHEQTKEINVKEYWKLKKKVKYKLLNTNFFNIVVGLLGVASVKGLEILFTNPITKDEIGQFLTNLLSYLLGAILIAMFFSIISKIHNKKYYFPKILFIISIGMSFVVLYSFIYPYLYISLFASSLVHYSFKVIFYLIILVIGYFVLRIIVPEIKKEKVKIMFCVVFLLYVSAYAIVHVNKKNSILKKFQAHLVYPIVNMQNFASDYQVLEKSLTSDIEKLSANKN